MLPDTSSVALVLGLTLVAAAAPATSGTHSSTPFSYSQWVEGIIANPDGLNLSVEEVIEVTKNDTFARNVAVGPLHKRVATCTTEKGASASAADTVLCINYLARKGQTACAIAAGALNSEFYRSGLSRIYGGTKKRTRVSSACNDVARAGGFIMDKCTKSGTVQGYEYAYGNGDLLVVINNPYA